MKTQAIIVEEDHVARLRDVTLPEMSPTRVRIANWYSGVRCGTEGDAVSGRATYITRPFLTGYQTVGQVIAVGEHVRKVQVGDTVFTNGGNLWPCPSLFGGSHARELVVEEADIIRLSPDIPSLRSAAYATLAAVGLEGISRMKLMPGRIMLVCGLGMLGQLAGKCGKLLGLTVVGVNRSAWKRDAAMQFGFDAVCPPQADALAQTLLSIGAKAAHNAVELTGNLAILHLALTHLASFGEMALLGYYPDPMPIDLDICHARQLTLHNPVGPGDQLPKVINWMESGWLDMEPLIRHTVTPDQTTEFYRDLMQRHSDHLGVVIDWSH
ncbi:MAG: zinc-binding dehydrogenase [Phycisphaeraceae bacterium]|nr:zinc-binding dehydrogenase [Phycisphaeraceae bacterium]